MMKSIAIVLTARFIPVAGAACLGLDWLIERDVNTIPIDQHC